TVLTAGPSQVIDPGLLSVSPQYDPDHILVRYKDAPQAVLAGTTVGRQVDSATRLYEVDLAKYVSVEGALVAYRQSAAVALAEPDYYLTTSAVPSDARFGDQWALYNTGQDGGKADADINALQAWQVATGSTKMVVSVMDSGIDYTHPDLYKNIWLN